LDRRKENSTATLAGVALTITSWSDSGIAATIPSGATSGLVIISLAPNMNDSNPVAFEVTSQPLPTPWVDEDVGSVGQAGSGTCSGGTFTVNGSGTSIGGTSDGMHFVYQPLAGDGSIIARVVSVSSSTAQAGVMIRETLDPSATNGSAFFKSYVYFYDRSSTGPNTLNEGNMVTSQCPIGLNLCEARARSVHTVHRTV